MLTTLSNSVPPRASTTDNYRWVMLCVYYLGTLAFGITFQSIPPLLPILIPELHLTYAQAGSLMGLYALPGLALSIPVGLWADRQRGASRIIFICYAAMLVGTLVTASATSYPQLVIGRLIAGAGGLSGSVAIARMITQWFRGRDLGLAMGLYSSGFPIATILSLTLLGDLAYSGGWPVAVLVGAVVCVAGMLALFLLHHPSPTRPAAAGPIPAQAIWKKTFDIGLPSWLVGIIWLLFNAATLSFITFGPVYFTAKGYDPSLAGLMSSILMFGSPVLGPIVGYLLDRYQKPEIFAVLSNLLVGLAILVVPFSAALVVLPLIIIGITSPFTPTSVMFLAGKVARLEDSGLAYGIVNFCLTASIVVAPFVVGLVKDSSGSYELAFVLMAAFALLGAAAAAALRTFRTRALEG
ncbi:MAG: MFS transporter [Chloroflexi bacterium]|nr:MFS transporter [Chloroflexota bacterium]